MSPTYSPLCAQTLPTTKFSDRNGQLPNNTILHGWAGTNRASVIYTLVTDKTRQASVHYMAQDGWIAGSVPEEYRAWTSSSPAHDRAAITIEAANSGGAPGWPFSDATVDSVVRLIADYARRYGKTGVVRGWQPQGSTLWGLIGHRDLVATACPQSLYPRLDELARRADQLLKGTAPAPAAPIATTVGDTYTVVHGDSLWIIAKKRLGNPERWPEIQRLNNLPGTTIRLGQILKLPTVAKPAPPPTVVSGNATGSIKPGARVRCTATHDYAGKTKLADAVRSGVYDVIQVSGDRVVIGHGKTVTAAVRLNTLRIA